MASPRATRAISIHAPREGCDGAAQVDLAQVGISIHAPREGCDVTTLMEVPASVVFQSTHPVRGATRKFHRQTSTIDISIHAPREGCDGQLIACLHLTIQFQSTHPVRGATGGTPQRRQGMAFQSTHPVRGATVDDLVFRVELAISIHAPREGCDITVTGTATYVNPFQSTHPVRGATCSSARKRR